MTSKVQMMREVKKIKKIAFVFYDFKIRHARDAQRNGECKDVHTDSLRRATNL